MLVCVFFAHFAHGTAGAARIRHSPRPLIQGARLPAQLGRMAQRERNLMSALAVIASNLIRTARRNGGEPPLPPNSGLPELGIKYCRSRIYPTSMRERVGVRGYGLSMEQNPSPGLHLRCNPTSPTRGEVAPSKRNRRRNCGRCHGFFLPESYFPVSNEHSAPPPAFWRISLGSTVQLSFEKLSMFDPAAPSGDTPAVAAVA